MTARMMITYANMSSLLEECERRCLWQENGTHNHSTKVYTDDTRPHLGLTTSSAIANSGNLYRGDGNNGGCDCSGC